MARDLTQHEELLAAAGLDAMTCDEEQSLRTLISDADADDAQQIDREIDAFELASGFAAVGFASSEASQTVPTHIGRSLEALASAWATNHAGVVGADSADAQVTHEASAPAQPRVHDQSPPVAGRITGTELGSAPSTAVTRSPFAGLGWIAAAACLALAIGAYLNQPSGTTTPGATTTNLAEARERLIDQARDTNSLTQWAWTNPTDDPASQGVQGDVVWDSVTQTGYMMFSGLAPNDPNQEQYQLWIFDATRELGTPLLEQKPVDGGVFDVASDGTVIVPIAAKLPIGEPGGFAVTIEQPGGVVVSERDRIPTLALPPSAG